MKLRLLILAVTSSLLFLSSPAAAFNPLSTTCDPSLGNGGGATSSTCKSNKSQNGSNTNPVVDTIKKVVDVIALVAGIVAVITIIYSGLRMVLSGNNPEDVKTARSTLIGSLIGLAIIAFSWAIASFIIAVVGGP